MYDKIHYKKINNNKKKEKNKKAMTEVQCSKRLIESLKEAALNTEGGVYRFVGMEIQNSVV